MGKRNAQFNGLRCVVCEKALTGRQEKFCSKKCMRDYWRPPSLEPIGRPRIIDKDVLRKLEEAFAFGATDTEACLYADISPRALYKYQEWYPDFVQRKKQLKERPVLLARQSVIRGMEDDPVLAFKYLERKRKDEFATKPPPGAASEGSAFVFINNVPIDGPENIP